VGIRLYLYFCLEKWNDDNAFMQFGKLPEKSRPFLRLPFLTAMTSDILEGFERGRHLLPQYRETDHTTPPMPAPCLSSFIFWIYLKKIFVSGTSVK
jgi:hypothetical protein